jgi:ADP-ribose pyrophosphatase
MNTENPWKTLASKKIYDNNWISLTEHQVMNPNGGEGIYGVVHFKNLAIGILPLDENYYTWIVGQYRFPLKAYSWEIIEGGGPLHIDPIESAQRELAEESGIRMHLSNSVSDELAIIYVAQDLQLGKSSPEETEELTIRKLHFNEVYAMVMNGTITDSISVAAILKVKILIDERKI